MIASAIKNDVTKPTLKTDNTACNTPPTPPITAKKISGSISPPVFGIDLKKPTGLVITLIIVFMNEAICSWILIAEKFLFSISASFLDDDDKVFKLNKPLQHTIWPTYSDSY
jgi:hypothetical protein